MKTNYRTSGTAAAANVARALKQILEGPQRLKLRGAAYRLCGNEGQVEELVQEACYRALRGASSFEANRPLMPWVLRILRNAYLDLKKASSKVSLERATTYAQGWPHHVSLLQVLADGTESSLDRVVRVEKETRVMRELNALPKIHRDALTVREIMGLSYTAGAKRLKVPVGTFRSRLSRARTLFRQLGRGA